MALKSTPSPRPMPAPACRCRRKFEEWGRAGRKILRNSSWPLYNSIASFITLFIDAVGNASRNSHHALLRNAPAIASAALRERVRRPAHLSKLANPRDLAPLFKNDDYIGWSGFTGVGYPKLVPTAMADLAEDSENKMQENSKKKFNLFVGASVGPEVENRWASLDMIGRRYPHQVGKEVARGINASRIEFADKHLSMFPQDLTYGYYSLRKKHGDPKKPLDWAIVEATAITEDGSIVPGASVGATPEIVQSAEKIIIEVNTHIPSLEGLHDINHSFTPPNRQPYLVNNPMDQIGLTFIPIDPDCVGAFVESREPDNTGKNAPENDQSHAIAGHLINFLSIGRCWLPPQVTSTPSIWHW